MDYDAVYFLRRYGKSKAGGAPEILIVGGYRGNALIVRINAGAVEKIAVDRGYALIAG